MSPLDHYERCAAANTDLPDLHDLEHTLQMRERQMAMLEHVRAGTWAGLGWADETTGELVEAIRGAELFLDVGAEAGFYTALALQHMGPDARVISIEPDPIYAAQLADAFAHETRLRIINAAAGSEPGTIRLVKPRGCSATAAGVEGVSFEAQVLTIDDVCLGLAPDVIKIDVEGAEALVLAGAQATLSARASTVFLEYHPWAEDIEPGSRDAIGASFRSAGFEVYRADAEGQFGVAKRIGGRMVAKPAA